MNDNNRNISTRQFILLYVMLIFTASIRVLPAIVVIKAKQAAWISPLIAIIALFLLISILHELFKNKPNINLAELCCEIFTKPVGLAISSIYFIWIMLLVSLYVRYYAERILSSILPYTPIEFVIIVMLLVVYVIVRGGLVPIARLNELLFGFLLFIFLIPTIISIFENLELINILPISRLDIMPVANASLLIMALWGYIVYLFFIVDEVAHKQDIRKMGFEGAFLLCIFAFLIIVATVGALGHSATSKIFLPYFAIVKNISAFYPLERMESIIISGWIIADYTIIVLFIYVAVNMLKTFFKLSEKKVFASPIILSVFSLSLLISHNLFELERFSENMALYVNIILCVGLPVAMLIVGKIRKII